MSALDSIIRMKQIEQETNLQNQKVFADTVKELHSNLRQKNLLDTLSKQGLRIKSYNSDGSVSFENEDTREKEANLDYKQSQTDLNRSILKNLEGTQQGSENLVYRDPATGVEIPQDQALKDIGEGKQYSIFRKQPSRTGIQEVSVSKPEDLTKEEKDYLITSERVVSSLDSLKDDIYPRLDDKKYNTDVAAFRAQKMPFWTIKDQNIQDYKSSITQLKADIPFLRGGKALTATESKRVDILLNPFGKSKETRIKDVDRFKKEFMGGAKLMKGGTRELNKRTTESQPAKSTASFEILSVTPEGE